MIGRTLASRYEVLERTGEGTFFQVLKGRDRQANRTVALKLMQPVVAAEPEVCRAMRAVGGELMALSHANIARVFDVGDDEGVPFLVTEFVRGIDLKERIRRIAPFTMSVAVDFAVAICEALHQAHMSSIVHGDLRAHNVVVSGEGAVKVTDFGMARVYATSRTAAAANQVRAVHYQAPEHAEGGLLSPATDLYALGVILFEMLTGGLPYPGDTPSAVALKHINDPVPSPRVLNPGVPRALEGIVMKSLQKRPEDRYRAASDMLTDLKRVRDALRFGKPLSWTPLDVAAPVAPAPADPPPARAPEKKTAERRPSPPPPDRPDTVIEGTPRMAPDRSSSDGVSPWLKFAIGFVIAVILLTCVLGAALWMAQYSKPTTITFPNMLGKSSEDARAEATRLGIRLIEREDYNDKYEPGVVYRSDYEVGRPIRPGRSVLVWVSKGSRLVWVPDVVKLSATEAEAKLKEGGLALGQVNRQNDEKVPFNCVISQNPRAGKRVERETAVSLVLSDGSENSDPTASTDTGASDADTTHAWNLRHKVKRDGNGTRRVRIEVEDSREKRTVFDEDREEGDVITMEVEGAGGSITVRTYYGDDPVPVSERNERIGNTER